MAKSIPLLVLLTLLNGCAAIAGYNYHAISNSNGYMDCGAYLGEPRAGGALNISGSGNYREIIRGETSIMVCSKDMYKESIYFLGPIIPIIPVFGLLGESKTPEYIEFYLLNRSNAKEVLLSSKIDAGWCIFPFNKSLKCITFESPVPSIKVPAKSVLNLKFKYYENIKLGIQFDDGGEINIEFSDERGSFYVITG